MNIQNTADDSDQPGSSSQKMENVILDLQNRIETDPYDIESYISIIDLYAEHSEHQWANYYRLRCSSYFALSPEMWEDCLEAQKMIAPGDSAEMEKIYQMALRDYRYKGLCLTYNQFIISEFQYETYTGFSNTLQMLLKNVEIWLLSYSDVEAHQMRQDLINFIMRHQGEVGEPDLGKFQSTVKHLFTQFIMFPNSKNAEFYEKYLDFVKNDENGNMKSKLEKSLK